MEVLIAMNQTDIFSLFGIVDEAAEQKKREEEEKRKKEEEMRKKQQEELKKKIKESASQSNNKQKNENENKKKKEEKEFKVNLETIIRYYGESIPITDYFTPEEITEGVLVKKKEETERKPIDAEMLRKKMEKEFPELVKEFTEMVFIPKKNLIIPTLKAKKKGNNCEKALSSDNAFPLIPFDILRKFITLAQMFGEEGLEIHGDIYFDVSSQSYFLDIPKQIVHPVWTEVSEDAASIVERVGDSLKVMEIHSHHKMRAFPSAQDNASERVPGMLYAIVGSIHNYFPEIYVRTFHTEKGHIQIDPFQVFENPFQSLPQFNMDDIEVSGL